MGNRYLNAYIETKKLLPEIKADVWQTLRSVGGIGYSTPTGYQINGGTYGTQMAFTANLVAQVSIQPIKENKYEIQILLSWTWSTLMWFVLVFGIIGGGIPWLMLLLHLFFDPAPAYQQALYRIVNYESL